MPRAREFSVKVVISNREGASDPEGETIYRDLVSKSGFDEVKGIRSGKFLRFEVLATDARSARDLVAKICDELRIYNPAAHSITVEA
ncbi:MAG: phosphoribosylformylglycinamidine synthase subunit PurS [Nitrososphaerales archaeon]|nr:phosphoribosylformylglycinamidine synthase subunit PurS [Nitrososphaerales archaeon]